MTTGSRRSGTAPVLLAVVAGLTLAGATAGTWVTVTVQRDIADAEVAEDLATAGVHFAPLGLALGLAAVLAGIALVPTRGRVRRLLGGLIALTGVAAVIDVGRGVAAVVGEQGSISALPALAALGAVAIVAAGVLAVRRQRPAPTLPERFDLDGEAADDEWHRAVDPREDEEGA